jgi:hypothetical protein
VLCGPEPFNHPELPAIVVGCIERGVARLGIETDAGALSVPGNAVGALRAGVRHFRVRMLGSPDETLTDALSGRPGLAHAAWDGVRTALEAADSLGVTVVVTVVMPVCRHSLAALPAAVARFAAMGAHAVRLTSAGPLPPSAEARIAAACDTGMVNHLWVETDGLLPLPSTHALHAVRGEDVGG